MKKLLSVLLTVAVLSSCVLTGCDKNEIDKDESQSEQSPTAVMQSDNSVDFVHSENPKIEIEEPSTCPLTQSAIDSIVINADNVIAQYPDFAGTVLLSVGNQIIYEKSYGNADEKGKNKNENDTFYQIGSVTKQFTGTAILMLEKEGKLRTSDTLDMYFKGYNYDFVKTITISQLLQMTSGMGDYMEIIEGDEEILNNYLKAAKKSEDDAKKFIVDTIFEAGIYTDPGTVYTYSNSAYYLLGMIIEQLSGMSYREYIQQNFFDLADMTDTYFVGDGKDYQTGYSPAQEKYISDNDDKYVKAEGDYPYLFSAGSVVSTVEDVNKWLDVVVSDSIFTSEDRQKVEKSLMFYNYGWNTAEGSWHHSGRTYAYSSQVYVDYKTDTKLVILTNVSFYNYLNEISYKIYNPMVAEVKKVKK